MFTSKESEEPRDGKQLRIEREFVQVVCELGVVKRDELTKYDELLLKAESVLFVEHLYHEFVGHMLKAEISFGFIVEVKRDKWRSERVQTLPIVLGGVCKDPRLQNSLELDMSLKRREEVMILVATGHIYLYLVVPRPLALFIELIINFLHFSMGVGDVENDSPYVRPQHWGNVYFSLGNDLIMRVGELLEESLEDVHSVPLVVYVPLSHRNGSGRELLFTEELEVPHLFVILSREPIPELVKRSLKENVNRKC